MLVFHDNGDGRPIVWIHGFPHASAIFQPQVAIPGVRHIRADLPGFGASAPPSATVSMADYSREIIAMLDHLHIENAIAAGVSMGGYILMQMLRDAPQRIEGVILIDTRERADSDQAREDRFKTIAEIEKNGVAPVVDAMLPKMILNEARREPFREIMMTATPAGMIAALRAMSSRRDSTSTLRALKVPALVIAGEQDQLMPRSELEKLAQGIPKARLEVVPAAGHLPFLEKPRIVAPLLTAHLQVRVRD